MRMNLSTNRRVLINRLLCEAYVHPPTFRLQPRYATWPGSLGLSVGCLVGCLARSKALAGSRNGLGFRQVL